MQEISSIGVNLRSILSDIILIIILDIKGANVLVDNAGVCKLADFGSAKKIKTLIEADMVNSLKGAQKLNAF